MWKKIKAWFLKRAADGRFWEAVVFFISMLVCVYVLKMPVPLALLISVGGGYAASLFLPSKFGG